MEKNDKQKECDNYSVDDFLISSPKYIRFNTLNGREKDFLMVIIILFILFLLMAFKYTNK